MPAIDIAPSLAAESAAPGIDGGSSYGGCRSVALSVTVPRDRHVTFFSRAVRPRH